MPTVTINLIDRKFDLVCSPDSQELLIKLGEELEVQVKKIRDANPLASFELLLVMTALHLQNNQNPAGNLSENQKVQQPPEDHQVCFQLLAKVNQELRILLDKLNQY